MWNCDLGQIRKTSRCIWLHCNGSGLFRTRRWRLTSPFGWPGIEIFTGQNNLIFLSSRFALFLFYSSKGDTRLPQYHNVRHQPDHSNTIYLIRYIHLWLCKTVVVLVWNDRQARQQRGTMEKLIEAESAAPYRHHTDDVIRETHWHLSTPALLVFQSEGAAGRVSFLGPKERLSSLCENHVFHVWLKTGIFFFLQGRTFALYEYTDGKTSTIQSLPLLQRITNSSGYVNNEFSLTTRSSTNDLWLPESQSPAEVTNYRLKPSFSLSLHFKVYWVLN